MYKKRYLRYKILTLIRASVFCKFPYHHTCRDRNVERVFGAKLWYLETAVALVHHFLMHSLHLVAHYHGEALMLAGIRNKVLKHRAALTLFHGTHLIPHGMKLIHGIRGVVEIPPVHAVFRTERRL